MHFAGGRHCLKLALRWCLPGAPPTCWVSPSRWSRSTSPQAPPRPGGQPASSSPYVGETASASRSVRGRSHIAGLAGPTPPPPGSGASYYSGFSFDKKEASTAVPGHYRGPISSRGRPPRCQQTGRQPPPTWSWTRPCPGARGGLRPYPWRATWLHGASRTLLGEIGTGTCLSSCCTGRASGARPHAWTSHPSWGTRRWRRRCPAYGPSGPSTCGCPP